MVFVVLKVTTGVLRGKLMGGIPGLSSLNSLQQYLLEHGYAVGKRRKANSDGRLVTIAGVGC
jgi:hypothetical protein